MDPEVGRLGSVKSSGTQAPSVPFLGRPQLTSQWDSLTISALAIKSVFWSRRKRKEWRGPLFPTTGAIRDIPIYIALARTCSQDHTWLQEWLGNEIFASGSCHPAKKVGSWYWGRRWASSAIWKSGQRQDAGSSFSAQVFPAFYKRLSKALCRA